MIVVKQRLIKRIDAEKEWCKIPENYILNSKQSNLYLDVSIRL